MFGFKNGQKWLTPTYLAGQRQQRHSDNFKCFKERENYKKHCLFSLWQAWFKNCKHFFPVICSLIITIDLYISRNSCNYNANQYNTHCINSRILFENYLTLFIKKLIIFTKQMRAGLLLVRLEVETSLDMPWNLFHLHIRLSLERRHTSHSLTY